EAAGDVERRQRQRIAPAPGLEPLDEIAVAIGLEPGIERRPQIARTPGALLDATAALGLRGELALERLDRIAQAAERIMNALVRRDLGPARAPCLLAQGQPEGATGVLAPIGGRTDTLGIGRLAQLLGGGVAHQL